MTDLAAILLPTNGTMMARERSRAEVNGALLACQEASFMHCYHVDILLTGVVATVVFKGP